MIQPANMGGVVYDRQINTVVSEMIPLTSLVQSSDAFANVYEIAMKLM